MENTNEVIRALSWKQPYASLMLHGKIETRLYSTKIRGKVLICAAQKPYTYSEIIGISGPILITGIDRTLGYKSVIIGHAIAIADLVDCRKMKGEDRKKCFVEYSPDLWCWIFENVQEIEPFPYKGKQGWGILTPDIIEQIKIKK